MPSLHILLRAVHTGGRMLFFLRSLIMRLRRMRVEVREIVEDRRPFQVVFDPQHPDDNEEGYVQLPNVNLLEEMVNMMSASRSYEANVTAVNSAKAMAQKALEVGR